MPTTKSSHAFGWGVCKHELTEALIIISRMIYIGLPNPLLKKLDVVRSPSRALFQQGIQRALFNPPFRFVVRVRVILWQSNIFQQLQRAFFAHGCYKPTNPRSDLVGCTAFTLAGSEFPSLSVFHAAYATIIAKRTFMVNKTYC